MPPASGIQMYVRLQSILTATLAKHIENSDTDLTAARKLKPLAWFIQKFGGAGRDRTIPRVDSNATYRFHYVPKVQNVQNIHIVSTN
jgi:hypothetical protein